MQIRRARHSQRTREIDRYIAILTGLSLCCVGAVLPSVGAHPKHIFFLTADAFGVLPPLSGLSLEQAMYHFLSGYTSKIAGTESGLGIEPHSTFSACFGAPFLPLPPKRYAEMLGDRVREHATQCWLLNTGWVGGRYGEGSRISLAHTRNLVSAVLEGHTAAWSFEIEPVFGLAIPISCDGVPSKILHPRKSWTDKRSYDAAAALLAKRFRENAIAAGIPRGLWNSGPLDGMF